MAEETPPRGTRKRLSEEFKRDAVGPARSTDRRILQAAKELGTSETTLRNVVARPSRPGGKRMHIRGERCSDFENR